MTIKQRFNKFILSRKCVTLYLRELNKKYTDFRLLLESRIYALQQASVRQQQKHEQEFETLIAVHKHAIEDNTNKYIAEIVNRDNLYKDEVKELNKHYNTPENIKLLYKSVREKEDTIISIKVVPVKKGTVKYNIMLIETSLGNVRINVGRDFDNGEGSYNPKENTKINPVSEKYDKIRELSKQV